MIRARLTHLALSRETVRELAPEDFAGARGGNPSLTCPLLAGNGLGGSPSVDLMCPTGTCPSWQCVTFPACI
ncbi:MAG TPA: hypothetical protein VG245_06420 [Candidatus Dormibacteraeota bacterium]|jgi:hypothetical protein|nr:hypothetical protein [Candidatus Dormibacteraeota bacterium]